MHLDDIFLKVRKMFIPITEFKDKIKLYGRCAMADDKINLEWNGSGFEICFKGDSIRVFFEKENAGETIYIRCEIDGKVQKVAISNSKEVFVADNLNDGIHSFKLLRLNEYYSPCDTVNVTGVDIGTKDCLNILQLTKKHRKRIDFYGDSITNGWHVYAEPDYESDMHCNCYNDYSASYAYLTANAFNANAYVCAVSGHGIISTWDGDRSKPMKMFYEMKSRSMPIKMDFSDKPDLIVVALGTNDWAAGVPEDQLKCGIRDFIKMLRSDALNTKIIWMYGMINDGYMVMMQELFADLKNNDINIDFLPITPMKAEDNEVGGTGHPNKNGQRRIANELINYINKKGILAG